MFDVVGQNLKIKNTIADKCCIAVVSQMAIKSEKPTNSI